MGNVLETYFDSEYTFTPYIPELVKPLDKIRGLILANLLTKLKIFNSGDTTVKHIYGKEYHFYYSKKDIAQKEILIDYSDFNKHMKNLTEYVTTFGGRQKENEGYNTTYFFLHVDKIKSLFDEGAKMLGKKAKKLSDNKKQKQSKQYTPKGLPENIGKALNSMNETELKYRNGEISENEYKQTTLPIEGVIKNKKYNLIKNNDVWEIRH
jgi:hypothetical protein